MIMVWPFVTTVMYHDPPTVICAYLFEPPPPRKTGGRLDGEVECEYGVIEGFLCGSLISSQVATVGPSARVYGDVIYNVLELDRVRRTY